MDTSLKGHLRSRQHFFMPSASSETITILRICISKILQVSLIFIKLDGSIFSSLLCDSSFPSIESPSLSHRWVINESAVGWGVVTHFFPLRIMSHPNSNIFKYYDIWLEKMIPSSRIFRIARILKNHKYYHNRSLSFLKGTG